MGIRVFQKHCTWSIAILCCICYLILCEETVKPPETEVQKDGGIKYGVPDATKESIALAEEEEEDLLVASAAVLKRILDKDIYDKSIRPKGLNGSESPVNVAVSLFIRNIENIDDLRMEYSLQLTFRETWIDPRLVYSHVHPEVKTLQLMDSDDIWVPDLFFSNEKTGKQHKLMIPNFFGRISPNGQVIVSYRITLQLSCAMRLEDFPLDTQKCPLRIASYGFLDTDLDLKWREDKAVEMGREFVMPRFRLMSYEKQTCHSVTSTGKYGCIQLFLEFKREFGYYMIQIYAPCIMLVLVSWIGFWLEPTATEARVSLAVTSILTVVTQVDSINVQVPPASYIKAIDVWTFAIQTMVFAAIIQFSYINFLVHYQWKTIAKTLDESDDYLRENKEPVLKERAVRKAKRVDNICKVCFPLTFGLFNLAYWTFYLRQLPSFGKSV